MRLRASCPGLDEAFDARGEVVIMAGSLGLPSGNELIDFYTFNDALGR